MFLQAVQVANRGFIRDGRVVLVERLGTGDVVARAGGSGGVGDRGREAGS